MRAMLLVQGLGEAGSTPACHTRHDLESAVRTVDTSRLRTIPEQNTVRHHLTSSQSKSVHFGKARDSHPSDEKLRTTTMQRTPPKRAQRDTAEHTC